VPFYNSPNNRLPISPFLVTLFAAAEMGVA
jgi:hypothetical protein